MKAESQAHPAFRAAAIGVILLGVTVRILLIGSSHATEEDLYITLRYARNLAEGAGFVYNPGEHVLGATTPLYTLILALFLRLHADPVLMGKLLGVGAEALSCWLVWRLGSFLGRPGAAIGAAACIAVAPLNLIESVKGMESSLVACACIATWAFWAERKTDAAWFCAALVTLLRIDGAALAAVLLLACFRRDRRAPRAGLLIYALLVLPWFLFATAYFGSPIPTSLRAKLIVYGWHNTKLLPNLLPFLRIMSHNPLSAFLLVGALLSLVFLVAPGILPALRNRSHAGRRAEDSAEQDRSQAGGVDLRTVVLPMLAWLLIYYAGMALSKVFLFGWYFLPPAPTYYLVAWLGWESLVRLSLPLPEKWPRLPFTEPHYAAAALAVTAAAAVFIAPRALRTLRESQLAEDALRIPIGLWLKENASQGDTVMLEPIGYIGYYSGLRVLDTVGLVSPEVLPLYRPDSRSPYHGMWTRFRPTWILLRAGEWEDLQRYEQSIAAGRRLASSYTAVQSWKSPGSAPNAGSAFILFHRQPE